MDWEGHAEREEARYADAVARLPEEPHRRQKQLVRAAMAAGGAGLARLMQGRKAEAAGWFTRSAERYRESWTHAPPESWGRLVGALKSRLLAGDPAAAVEDARWALEQRRANSPSPICRYASTLAFLVLGEDGDAAPLAHALVEEGPEAFPPAVASALAALAASDAEAYREAVSGVLESFETREAYLEDVTVADTVIVLQALAAERGLAPQLASPLLPP